MSIPKIIHYVWVGNNDKSKDIKKCMETWGNHLKDYKVIEWNEKNFDINKHKFIKKAYEEKKWAFVSDYIRAYVIYNYGGIYLDTDIILLDNFDEFLNHKAFVGFENIDHPFTAVFGAEKNHPLIKDMLDYYDNLERINFNFESNNTISVSDILITKYGCKKDNMFQILRDDIAVYPDNILCNPSKKSVSIHIFTGTWLDNKTKLMKKVITKLKISLNKRYKAEIYRRLVRR